MAKKKTAVAEMPPGTTEAPPLATPATEAQEMTSPASPGEAANSEPNGHEAAPTSDAPTQPDTNGPNGDKRGPAFKVGPIATDKDNAVSVAVWGNEITTRDGRTFTVYNVTCEARWRDADGTWRSGKQFRGSQVYALIYCLQRASDWILSQRDPQNSPF